MSKVIAGFLDDIGRTPADVDIFVPHQANIYMIGQLAKKLKIDPGRMWKSGDRCGNPASGSVPLTIAHNAAQRTDGADRVLISGFGGGLSVSVGEIALAPGAVYAITQYDKEK